MTLTYKEIRDMVELRVKKRTIDLMVKFLKNRGVKLGGHQQPITFIRRSVYLQLYKDCYHVSFSLLSAQTKLWYTVNHKTLDKNIKKVREELYLWGKSQVTPGSLSEWENAIKKVKIPKQVQNTCLWIDSTDCQVERKDFPLKQHPLYSGKIKKVALRRMVITDGKRKIRYFSDGYTPKLYDSHWAKINKDMLINMFNGGVFIGDSHFQKFEKETGIKCYTPIVPSVGKRKKDSLLSKSQEDYNNKQKGARAVCEGVFGEFKTKFDSLNFAWAESEHQQDYLFSIACGVHNTEL